MADSKTIKRSLFWLRNNNVHIVAESVTFYAILRFQLSDDITELNFLMSLMSVAHFGETKVWGSRFS